MSIDTAAAKLLGVLKADHFKPKGITRRLTITNPTPPGKPRTVIGSIGEGEDIDVGQEVSIGSNERYAAGEVYEIEGTGDPNDPQWRIVRQIVPRNPAIGADLYAALPAPVWSAITNPDDSFANPICLATEPDLDPNTGANGEPLAVIHAIYRTIVPGSYSVFKEYLQKVQLQLQRTTPYDPAGVAYWRTFQPQQITPSRPIRITLNENLDASETAVDITLPADVSIAELLPGFYLHWRIDGEIVIAKVVSTVLMTVLAVSGRGAEGTTAATHTSGAQIELLSGFLTVRGIDPGVDHTARVAFVDGHDVAGPPSVTNVLLTWKRVTLPALTAPQFRVDLQRSGYKLDWDRPTDPTTSLPMTSRLFYKIYRNTSASTSGAKVVEERISNLSTIIPTTLWDTDATREQATWFGIQVMDGFGNASATGGDNNDGIQWAQDNVLSTNPSIGSWLLVPNDTSVHVEYNRDNDTASAVMDPGFAYFALLRATSTGGANETVVGTFGAYDIGSASIDYNPPLDRAYYFQIVSVDLAGNVTAAVGDDQHWRIGIPGLLANGGIINGAFQIPGPTRTVSDGVSTNSSTTMSSATAKFTADDIGQLIKVSGAASGGADYYGFIYEVTSATAVKVQPAAGATVSGASMVIGNLPYGWVIGVKAWSGTSLPLTATYFPIRGVKKVEYLTTGGTAGNRALKVTFASGTYGVATEATIMFMQRVPKPYNTTSGNPIITVSVKADAAVGADIAVSGAAISFEDDFGQTDAYPSNTNFSNDTTPSADGAWHQYSKSLGWLLDESLPASGAGIARYGVGVSMTGPDATEFVVWFDDVLLTT